MDYFLYFIIKGSNIFCKNSGSFAISTSYNMLEELFWNMVHYNIAALVVA
jgi:hypothetical protein